MTTKANREDITSLPYEEQIGRLITVNQKLDYDLSNFLVEDAFNLAQVKLLIFAVNFKQLVMASFSGEVQAYKKLREMLMNDINDFMDIHARLASQSQDEIKKQKN